MVDITRCELCGRVIPATEHGCAYCEQEREDRPDGIDRPYLPLAVRLLLVLFTVDLLATGTLAFMTVISAGDSASIVVIAILRLSVASGTLVALVWSRPWGRFVPFVFLGVEILGGLASLVGWLPPNAWRADLFAPIWNALFLFLFLRPDVQGRFDRKVLDRRELGDLIRVVQQGRRDP